MASDITIFGYRMSDSTQDELVADAMRPLAHGDGVSLVTTMNVDHVVTLRKNPLFRAAYDFASVVVADGMPIVLVARMKGCRAHRITGSDLTKLFAERLTPGLHRPFYLVSQPIVGERLVDAFVARGFARGDVAFICPPMGFESDPVQSATIVRAVSEFGATHLFLGVGSPKSEVWIYEHRLALGDLHAFSFGAGLDFLAGTQKRAPKLVSDAGFEWLWRLASQPKRLWRRYLVNSWTFLPVAFDELFAKR